MELPGNSTEKSLLFFLEKTILKWNKTLISCGMGTLALG